MSIVQAARLSDKITVRNNHWKLDADVLKN